MSTLPKAEKSYNIENETNLFNELDKGIDSMERGDTIPHEDAMAMIRERVQQYYVQNQRDN